MTQTYAEKLMTDPDFIAEIEAAERRTHRYIVVWWAVRVSIIVMILVTWALMFHMVNTVNEIRDQLRNDTRIVIDAPLVEEEDGVDA